MDFCSDCGQTTEPDWVFCRSCGYALDTPDIENATTAATTSAGPPKVELISRGWDAIDVDEVELPSDPLLDEPTPTPLPPGTIEVSVDDITVVEQDEEADESAVAADEATPPDPADDDKDRWDHLRPHGQIPGVTEPTTIPARVSRIAVLLVALGALVAGGVRFYLNAKLDAFGEGSVSARAVNDVEVVADFALIVVAAFAVLAAVSLGWWVVKAKVGARFRPGPAEFISLASGVAGVALVVTFMVLDQTSVTAAIAANSLVILGLGLVVLACLALVRSVTRIEFESPR